MTVMERSVSKVRGAASPVARVAWRVGTPSRPQLALVVTVAADGQGVAEVTKDGHTREVCGFFAVIRIDGAAGLMHIDSDHFAATVKLGAQALYARTDLFAELGVPGGRYEIVRE